ncbi:CLUMA_CG017121, isoform A [Clunio marinus]|uniref:CLUMA_CG017121, isoform A n=1 Tax=Clunio marinus TaxID=568069 RepID=A0A1J1IUS1_9DIPT|nr:CLUMA_CG017121, isoform A [Clunio marinus]
MSFDFTLSNKTTIQFTFCYHEIFVLQNFPPSHIFLKAAETKVLIQTHKKVKTKINVATILKIRIGINNDYIRTYAKQNKEIAGKRSIIVEDLCEVVFPLKHRKKVFFLEMLDLFS